MCDLKFLSLVHEKIYIYIYKKPFCSLELEIPNIHAAKIGLPQHQRQLTGYMYVFCLEIYLTGFAQNPKSTANLRSDPI